MQGGLKNPYDSIKAFSGTDIHEDTPSSHQMVLHRLSEPAKLHRHFGISHYVVTGPLR
jgi:hypothetical protein